MSSAPDDASSSVRLTVVGLVGLALALVLPSLLASPFDATAMVTVTLVALALAALVRLANNGKALAARTISVVPSDDGELIVMPARVTDPVHHPLRPRAPGTV
jgi:hypothetical protein